MKPDYDEKSKEIVNAAFDVEKTIRVLKLENMSNTAVEYQKGANECISGVSQALQEAHSAGRKEEHDKYHNGERCSRCCMTCDYKERIDRAVEVLKNVLPAMTIQEDCQLRINQIAEALKILTGEL